MSLDQFELYNPAQLGQKKSLLRHLIEICAFREEWLLDAARILETLERPHVVAFFQIPQALFVEDKTYELPAKTPNIQIGFQFRPFALGSDLNGQIRISDPGVNEAANSTQVVAYVPLWGKRATYYGRYARCFTANGMKDDVVIDSREYWGARTLRTRDFEFEVCSRVEQELEFSLRRFLKSHSTIVKAMHANTDRLYSLFMMVYPGRLAHHSAPVPLLTHFLRASLSAQSNVVAADKIMRGVGFTYRSFSRFELQIFELNKLAKTGSHALALVGALSLAEWLLRLSAPRADKKLPLSKLIRKFAERRLDESILESLDELRKLRNIAVHLGESTDLSKRPHEIFQFDVDDLIDADTAQRAIELAWLVFQKSNSGTLTSNIG